MSLIHRRGSQDRSRGAAFIEFALAVPLITLLALGIVEMGLGWMAANDLNAAVRDAARSGTSAPAYATSDRTILIALGTSLSAKEISGIQKVIVYRADADGNPTPHCRDSINPSSGSPGSFRGDSGECNVYGKSQIAWLTDPAHPEHQTDTTYFATSMTSCNGTQLDNQWCPSKRNHSIASGELDYLGVRVVMKHDNVTHFGFSDMTITRQAVFRLEPKYGEN